MRLQLRTAVTAVLVLSLVLAGPSTGSLTATAPDIEVVPAVIDLTAEENQAVTIPAELLTPEAARNIGPGSGLIITIPDVGRFGLAPPASASVPQIRRLRTARAPITTPRAWWSKSASRAVKGTSGRCSWSASS
jgi:hypothetical protein